MSIELSSPIVEQEKVIQPEIKIELVDIIGKIIIDVDNHKVDFEYGLYEYVRDENGNIVTDTNGKKEVRLIKTKKLSVGDNYYSDAFSETITNMSRAESIEGKLIDWIKQFDSEFTNINISYVDSSTFVVV